MTEIGEVYESRAEFVIDWKIKDFSSLSQETNARYHSPKFYFSGSSWKIRIYPNGQTKIRSCGWIDLYLVKTSNPANIVLEYSFALRTVNGKPYWTKAGMSFFEEANCGWGKDKYILRSDVMKKESELIPSDILTVTCTLTNNEPSPVNGSLFRRHQEICDNLKDIYEKKKRTDCILKVNGANIPAHRMILETRSPVFAAMFRHDTRETQTGEVSIVDVDKCGMEGILEYIYSGDIKKLETQTVLPIYVAAEKYDVKNVKELCLDFIMKNLSTEWVLDVIKFAELYDEKELSHCARNYFKKNARRILKTEMWKTFARENHNISIELLGTVVEDLLPE